MPPQLIGTTQALKDGEVPIYHPMYHFKDDTSETPKGYDVYKVLIDSDEGRAYAKLTTDPERLQFMRQHGHEIMPIVYATMHFYEDRKAGKEYSILIDSLEGKEVDTMMGDSDAEQSEEANGKLLAYFKAHAHEVHTLPPKTVEGKIEDEKSGK